MNIKLNTWQTLALFLPAVIGYVLLLKSQTGFGSGSDKFAVPNIFFLLNAFLIMAYQSAVIIKFISAYNFPSEPVKWNSIVCSIIIVLLLLRIIRSTFLFHHSRFEPLGENAVRSEDSPAKDYGIMLVLAYTFVTYFFINNRFVSKRLKQVKDVTRQKQIKAEILLPMQRLRNISVIMIIILGALSTIAYFT